MPSFVVGEKRATPTFVLEKETKPPNQFTEATLLRAMETAGKQVDDEDLRELMKENGIGRPSTRANIIETLFRRQYIVRNKKQVLPTPTGIQLIDTIQNELVKSAELTGLWEKQLKDIEKGSFTAVLSIKNMKQMVETLVYEVRRETRGANISHAGTVQKQEAVVEKKKAEGILSEVCPKCKKATLIKGKSAYGCGNYKAGLQIRFALYFCQQKNIREPIFTIAPKRINGKLERFQNRCRNGRRFASF